MQHGLVVRLLTSPDLLRHIRLKLWLRNDFPGQSVELQLSATLPSVARWWVKCRTKLPGGESLEPALCQVTRLVGHCNAFLEVGPLQPLDYPSDIWFHMVSVGFVGAPCDEVYSVYSQSPPSVLCCARFHTL